MERTSLINKANFDENYTFPSILPIPMGAYCYWCKDLYDGHNFSPILDEIDHATCFGLMISGKWQSLFAGKGFFGLRIKDPKIFTRAVAMKTLEGSPEFSYKYSPLSDFTNTYQHIADLLAELKRCGTEEQWSQLALYWEDENTDDSSYLFKIDRMSLRFDYPALPVKDGFELEQEVDLDHFHEMNENGKAEISNTLVSLAYDGLLTKKESDLLVNGDILAEFKKTIPDDEIEDLYKVSVRQEAMNRLASKMDYKDLNRILPDFVNYIVDGNPDTLENIMQKALPGSKENLKLKDK